MKLNIAVGSDHAGFDLKEALLAHPALRKRADLIDCGAPSADPVDYPKIAFDVAHRLTDGEFDRAILICGSGNGMAIAANRARGIRAALCRDVESAQLAARHNDANIITIAARQTTLTEAADIALAWLESEFEGERHARRIKLIDELSQAG